MHFFPGSPGGTDKIRIANLAQSTDSLLFRHAKLDAVARSLLPIKSAAWRISETLAHFWNWSGMVVMQSGLRILPSVVSDYSLTVLIENMQALCVLVDSYLCCLYGKMAVIQGRHESLGVSSMRRQTTQGHQIARSEFYKWGIVCNLKYGKPIISIYITLSFVL